MFSDRARTCLRGVWIVAIASVAALIVAACGSSSGGSRTSTAGSAGSAGTTTTASANAVAANGCGSSAPVGPSNPDGIYKTLSPALKKIYSSYPGKLTKSIWATKKITAKPPWKIGFIQFAITNQFNADVLTGLKQQFAQAKKQGLVTGSLYTDIPATAAASTPEEQISAIQQMVREGVNAIIINPVDSVSETPAMNAAGKAGVPVILADIPPAPGSIYTLSVWSQNQTEADAGTLGLIKKGNIILVKGIPGNENDVVLYHQKIADLKRCPNIHVAATLYGQWDNGTTKTVVSQYLASHPQPIQGVLQDGGMFAGTVEAFLARGEPVPPVSDGECYGGDLSWWLKNKSKYSTVAGCFNGFQAAFTYWDATMRLLANKEPKYNVLSIPSVTITDKNLTEYAKPGLPLTSSAEIGGPVTAWCSHACMNKYFIKPGAVTSSKDVS